MVFKRVRPYSIMQYEILWDNIVHYGLPPSDIQVYDMPWYNIWNYQCDVIQNVLYYKTSSYTIPC